MSQKSGTRVKMAIMFENGEMIFMSGILKKDFVIRKDERRRNFWDEQEAISLTDLLKPSISRIANRIL